MVSSSACGRNHQVARRKKVTSSCGYHWAQPSWLVPGPFNTETLDWSNCSAGTQALLAIGWRRKASRGGERAGPPGGSGLGSPQELAEVGCVWPLAQRPDLVLLRVPRAGIRVGGPCTAAFSFLLFKEGGDKARKRMDKILTKR